MHSDQLLERLVLLQNEATNIIPLPKFLSWKSRCIAVLRAAFGPDGPQIREFERAVQVLNEGYVVTGGDDREHWAGDAMARGAGVLEGAIYALELRDNDAQLDELAIDEGLWINVQGLVASEDWGKIPAAVTIYVEDTVRRWGGDPRSKDGGALVGKSLYAKVMGPDGELRLGNQGGEYEGWRNLATGLAQAISNVDRHSIQRRPDAKRYAMGVLGLGSLLLTQLRREHEDKIFQVQKAEADTSARNDDQTG